MICSIQRMRSCLVGCSTLSLPKVFEPVGIVDGVLHVHVCEPVLQRARVNTIIGELVATQNTTASTDGSAPDRLSASRRRIISLKARLGLLLGHETILTLLYHSRQRLCQSPEGPVARRCLPTLFGPSLMLIPVARAARFGTSSQAF